MMEKLKQIYRNKIIENVTTYEFDKYYYFYKPNSIDVFGIEKTISENEYYLIKTNYIEKKVYDNNKKNQLIYEYLFDNKAYPFKNKKVKIMILDVTNKNKVDIDLISDIFKNFFKEVRIINLDNIYIVFGIDSFQIELSKYISSINYDLGITIKFHEGINLNQNITGIEFLNYIMLIKQYLNITLEEYTDITTPLINNNLNYTKEYAEFIGKHIIKPILADPLTKDIVLTYFKNDLNVSKTAKDLYINRNSLLNKFEFIFKETGFNLQKFSHACSMYLFVLFKGNKD